MGNESTASAKTPAPLASQSAWARGPPQSSPSPQSSAPSHLYPIPASHSRRPSVLVQGVPIPQGVSIPRKIMGPVRQGSSLNFGSIGDASAPVSSSPTTTPVVRHESVKAFGSLPATAATRSNIMNGKVTIPASGSTTGSSEPSSRPPATVPSISSSTSAAASSLSASPVTTSSNVPASAPNITQSTLSGTWSVHTPSASSGPTFNVAKLFLDNPSAFQPFSDVTSPSLQPSNLPHQPSSAGQHALQPPVQALPLSAHPYTSYGPGLRPSRGAGGSGSPTFPRALPNVTDPPPQPIPGPGGPSVPANPKTPTHPHSPSSAGVPAQQHPMQPTHRPGYYNMEYGSQWYHPTQAPYSMGHAPHAPGPILQGPPHPNIPLSPQTQPPFPSDTSIVAHAVPDSPHTHQPSASFRISPPLPTPSTSITSGGRSLNTITTTSVPMASRPHKIAIRNVDGKEVKLESLLESLKMPSLEPSTPQSFPVGTGRQSTLVRFEGKRARRKRKEQARLEQQNQEAEERAKKEEEGPERKEGGAAERRDEEQKTKEGRAEMEQEEGACAERETERQRLEEVEAETLKASDIAEPLAQELFKVEEGEVNENGEALVTQVNGASNPAGKEQESLRTDTSESTGRPPGPLDINAAKKEGSTPRPSALLTARNIDRLDEIEYPEGVRSPKTELNENARDGKFRYDRDFLLQFMAVCKERPPNLSSLDFLTIGVFDKPSRKRSGPRCQTGPTPASGVRSASIGIDLGSFTPSGPFAMGQFGTPSTEFTSEERFLMSQSARSAFVGGGPTALPSHSALTQTPGQGGPGGKPGGRHTRSKRGKKHIDLSRVGLAHQGPGFGLSAADVDTSEVANWIVKSLLNKLTVENFDSISDQIVTWANKSENEKDGRTLIQVIKLVLEKATDEANRSEMYARLCRKMMETISPKVQDDGIKNAEGKSITGGQLFRKYLLNRCQDDFERVWAAQENAARTATAKATDDEVIKAANERKGDESELYSDEYYAAQTAKRQGLGLIKFIGELFKLQMLTERIMHECVKKLLSTVENAGEEEIESLCQLLRTVGQLLDVPKARAHMDVYFQRIRELCKSLDVSPRMQSMLLDLIELRDRKWQSPDVMNAPTTLAAVHEAAAKEKAVQEVQAFQRQFSVSYGGSNRSAERNAEPAPDGWAVAGGSQPRLPSKAGDLSHFGKISKAAPMVMGPSSVFAGKKDTKRESITHTNSSPNMFSMLSQNPELVIEAKLSGASRQRPQNLQHLHRTFPAPGEAPLPTPEPTAAPAAQLSGKDTKKMIDEDTKEFFSVRNLEEEDEYLTAPAS